MINERLITIGEVLRPHGLRGEIKVFPLTDRPGRFDGLEGLIVLDPDTQRREPRRIQASRVHGGAVVLKLEGSESVADAQALVGRLLTLPESEALPLPPGQFYPWELEGCRVVTQEGSDVGVIVGVEPGFAQDRWVIQTGRGERLIPAVTEIVVKVDLESRVVVIRPPEGLLELS